MVELTRMAERVRLTPPEQTSEPAQATQVTLTLAPENEALRMANALVARLWKAEGHQVKALIAQLNATTFAERSLTLRGDEFWILFETDVPPHSLWVPRAGPLPYWQKAVDLMVSKL